MSEEKQVKHKKVSELVVGDVLFREDGKRCRIVEIVPSTRYFGMWFIEFKEGVVKLSGDTEVEIA